MTMATDYNLDEDTNSPDMEAAFSKEVNVGEAEATLKRNMTPGGYYVTNPDEYPGTVTIKKIVERGPDKEPLLDEKGRSCFRDMASVFVRGFQITKEGAEIQTMLRFDVSPQVRKAKVWVPLDPDEPKGRKEWQGEYEKAKDDMPTKLWAQAVALYKETSRRTSFTEGDVLEFLEKGTYSIQTFQGDSGLVIRSLHTRRARA